LLGSLWFSSFSAGGGGAAADYELISTTILGSSAASVTFSGLGTSAAAYKHLQIRMTGRGDVATAQTVVGMRMNSDTGTNYGLHRLTGNGSSVSSGGNANNDWGYAGIVSAASAGANQFGASIIDILDFSSSVKNKTVRTLTGNTSGNEIDLYSFVWLSTSAVTSLNLYPPAGGNWVTGSRFSLYGLK
jgi:hypothetical protein